MERYKIKVEYDGTPFVGWQFQKNGQSIQEVLQNAIFNFSKEKVVVTGAGRTDSGVHALKLFADSEIQQRFIPRMTTTNIDELWQGAQFMTEREGGSDVANITTKASFKNGEWHLYGEKWFCSNADASVSLLLARPEGASAGSRGLGLFVMPRILDDGSRNYYRIIRLKDKLGTRSMASGEIKLEGAIAYPIGAVENGLKQMLEIKD